jgi:hypothetical protein
MGQPYLLVSTPTSTATWEGLDWATRPDSGAMSRFKTSGAAASFFNGLRAIAHRCPAFVLSGAGFKVTTRVFGIARIAGGRTFQVNESGTGGAKLTIKLVFTVVGPDVFFDGAIGLAAAPPTSPSLRTIMVKLINRVHAHR